MHPNIFDRNPGDLPKGLTTLWTANKINEVLVPCHPSKWLRRTDILRRFNWIIVRCFGTSPLSESLQMCDEMDGLSVMSSGGKKMRCGLVRWCADAWCVVSWVLNSNTKRASIQPKHNSYSYDSTPGVLGFQVWELSIFWSQGNRLWRKSWRKGWMWWHLMAIVKCCTICLQYHVQ